MSKKWKNPLSHRWSGAKRQNLRVGLWQWRKAHTLDLEMATVSFTSVSAKCFLGEEQQHLEWRSRLEGRNQKSEG
ncbi:MAG TPA: hypothetical protein ACFE0H_04105 [Elainellaceae cyanobacterium]